MRIGFYPGCSLNGTSREYNESVKALAQAMGLELIELKDWNCCGATAAHSMSKQLVSCLTYPCVGFGRTTGISRNRCPLRFLLQSVECGSIRINAQ